MNLAGHVFLFYDIEGPEAILGTLQISTFQKFHLFSISEQSKHLGSFRHYHVTTVATR